MARKVYQVWPGNNRFCCGRCLTGPISDIGANFCYYFCFIGLLIPYCIFIAPALWKLSPLIPLATLITCVVSAIFFILVGFSDPGIIPRRAFLETDVDAPRPQFDKYLLPDIKNENGLDLRKFCATCKIYRPPRASHCSTCQNCVLVFDHHCPFVNNCIGKRNYRYFIGFLLTVMLSIVLLFVSAILFFINLSGQSVNSSVAIIVCSVVVGIIAVPLFGFFLFHLYLVCTKKTTRQLIKNEDNKQHIDISDYDWCTSDIPLVDFQRQLTRQQVEDIEHKLREQQNINNPYMSQNPNPV